MRTLHFVVLSRPGLLFDFYSLINSGQSHVSPDPGVASNRHFISTVFFLLLFLFLFLFLVIKINVAKASKPFGQCSLNSM